MKFVCLFHESELQVTYLQSTYKVRTLQSGTPFTLITQTHP